jgi:hypothetical protein
MDLGISGSPSVTRAHGTRHAAETSWWHAARRRRLVERPSVHLWIGSTPRISINFSSLCPAIRVGLGVMLNTIAPGATLDSDRSLSYRLAA